MRDVTPKVELGLGGSYFARVIADGLGAWHDWRMRPDDADQTISNQGTRPFLDADSNLPQLSVMILRGSPLPLLRQASPLPEGGLAVTFDGVQHSMDVGNDPTRPGPSPISFAVGLTIASLPGVGQEPALMRCSSDRFALTLRSDGRVYGYYNGSAVVDGAISLDTPTLVHLTRAGSSPDEINLYINGTLVDSATPALVSLAVGIIQFARNAANTQFLAATYFHVAIDSVALTQSQVTQQFAAMSWTDVSDDVETETPVVGERGIRDHSPLTRVAGTGVAAFALDNSIRNQAGLNGRYSPGHVNCRTGFAKGIPARISYPSGSGDEVLFVGRVRGIAPDPGENGDRRTYVTVKDFMDEAEKFQLDQMPIMQSTRFDRVFDAIVERMPNQPYGIERFTGSDVYPLALDNTQDEAVYADEEFVRLADSEFGLIFQRRTGVMVAEARHTRLALQQEPMLTLDGRFLDMDVAEISDQGLNSIQYTVNPREVDATATTVLASIESPLELAPGSSRTFNMPYRSPGTDIRVGGLNMVVPAPVTDYAAFEFDDGSGTDYTASIVVVSPVTSGEIGGNSVEIALSNPLSVTVFVTFFRIRGRGVYTFQPIPVPVKNDQLIASDGLQQGAIHGPYQSDINVGHGIATLVLDGYGSLGTRARKVTMSANVDDMPADLLSRDISDRVRIEESQTALDGEYYINGVRFEFTEQVVADVTWWLTPADATDYWMLDTVGASELGQTTRLAAA